VRTTVFGSFEWDNAKAALNITRRGISFAEASTVFEDPNAFYFDNGSPEGRICVIGFSAAANLLLVVYIEAGKRTRIVSARRPTRKERLLY
jgi:uncharacterized DUF497 family protein